MNTIKESMRLTTALLREYFPEAHRALKDLHISELTLFSVRSGSWWRIERIIPNGTIMYRCVELD